jgi:hypothetical protein
MEKEEEEEKGWNSLECRKMVSDAGSRTTEEAHDVAPYSR